MLFRSEIERNIHFLIQILGSIIRREHSQRHAVQVQNSERMVHCEAENLSRISLPPMSRLERDREVTISVLRTLVTQREISDELVRVFSFHDEVKSGIVQLRVHD